MTAGDASEIRINARLIGDDARRFRELQRREGLSASDLLRDALREYHASRAKPRADAARILDAAGFVGGGEGPDDLSTRYKTYLTEALDDKHALAVHGPPADDRLDPRR